MPKAKVRRQPLSSPSQCFQKKTVKGYASPWQNQFTTILSRSAISASGKEAIIELETGRKTGRSTADSGFTIGPKGSAWTESPWYVVKKNVHDNVVYVRQAIPPKRTWRRASSRRDALHIRAVRGRCIVARKGITFRTVICGISIGHAHPP